MKHIIKYIIPVLFILAACEDTDVDNIFEETPEARAQQEVDALTNDLIASEYGWLAEYHFVDSVMNTYLKFDFKENNRVVIKSVYDEYEEKESSYTIKYTQQLDLTFDSYSVLASLVDLTHGADFRWELIEKTEDSYKFISRADRAEGQTFMVFKKANQTADQFMADQKMIQDVRVNIRTDMSKSFFRNLRTDGSPFGYRFGYNEYTDEMQFEGVFDGQLSRFITKVDIQTDGSIDLEKPLVISGNEVRQFKYDEENDAIKITDSDGVEGAIIYDNRPFMNRKGLSDDFIRMRLSYIGGFSNGAMELYKDAYDEIPGLAGTQFYNMDGFTGALLVKIDGNAYSFGGMTNMTFAKLQDNVIAFIKNDPASYIEDWFEPLYESSEAIQKYYDDFLCDKEGFFVEYMDLSQEFYLVSKKDPTLYFKLIPVQ